MEPVGKTKLAGYELLTGNDSAAYGAALARVEVVSAYPITPQTTIVEKLAQFIASGRMKARFLNVESEHSALAALVGAASTGVRCFTASSSQGLAYMHEMVHWAGRGRLPIVMAVPNRALGAPSQIGTEQDDSLSDRDTGWLQFYCESNQEILDTVIQAFRISEQVSLPVMVAYEGFYQSHLSEPVLIPDIELVDRYLPRKESGYTLNPDKPMIFFVDGGMTGRGMEYNAQDRRRTQEAMEAAEEVARSADNEFERLFGRRYGFTECYRTEDAEIILVMSSGAAGIGRVVVDDLRKQGKKAGLLRIRLFRPFPGKEIARALANAQKIAVIDRNLSYGHCGVFAMEVKAAMYNEWKRPPIFGFVAGLGGLPITPELVSEVMDYTERHELPQEDIVWKGIAR